MRPFGPTPGKSGICFGTLADFIDPLEEARAAGRIERRLKTRTRPAPPVVDGFTCLSVLPNGAKQFYQLVNARCGRASTALVSSTGFGQWGEILHDEVMAAGLLDRLLHRCRIVSICGSSSRMRRQTGVSKAIDPTASRAGDAENARQREKP
ncbi:MAG: ATP-binding protein [Gammaproteobacteria bacterium]|nr:ATP-binding protein [Gammaproteobacteria bacterium]